ncbi:MAG: hypothetical protein K8H88_12900 [Sandaracinaceae bacterium]|nr:hypothetical protein [Sandaracinaceae bacterium]
MKLVLAKGGEGEATSFDGDVLVTILPRAYAPGSPCELRVEDLTLTGKTLGAKRRADGRFDVRVRLISVRREARERLLSALGAERGRPG